MSRLLALLLFAAACAPTDGASDDTDAPADTAQDSDTRDTGGPGDTGTPDDTGAPADTSDTGTPVDTGTPADTSDSGDTADTGTPAGPLTDACDNTADIDVLGTATDIDSVSQTCTVGCIATPPLGACAATCIETELGISAGCATCFGTYSACLVNNCTICALNASGNLCQTCLANNCNGPFETCAGVPLP